MATSAIINLFIDILSNNSCDLASDDMAIDFMESYAQTLGTIQGYISAAGDYIQLYGKGISMIILSAIQNNPIMSNKNKVFASMLWGMANKEATEAVKDTPEE